MDTTYLALLLVGAALGYGAAAFNSSLRGIATETKHEETVIEQGKEIARLRAQVASLIGKE